MKSSSSHVSEYYLILTSEEAAWLRSLTYKMLQNDAFSKSSVDREMARKFWEAVSYPGMDHDKRKGE